MALQGTLETFALADVLRLLASTKKSGVLRIDGGRGHGEMSIADGELVGASATGAPRAERPAEVLFELLRYETGSFVFDGDIEVVTGDHPVNVDEALADAEEQLREWREIEAVVPSPTRLVTLFADRDKDITLNPRQWAAVVALGEGASTNELSERLGVAELPATRLVRDLVELGAVEIGDEVSLLTASTSAATNVVIADLPTTIDPVEADLAFIDEPDASSAEESPLEDVPFEDAAPEVSGLEEAVLDAPDSDSLDSGNLDSYNADLDSPDLDSPDLDSPGLDLDSGGSSLDDILAGATSAPPPPPPPPSRASFLDLADDSDPQAPAAFQPTIVPDPPPPPPAPAFGGSGAPLSFADAPSLIDEPAPPASPPTPSPPSGGPLFASDPAKSAFAPPADQAFAEPSSPAFASPPPPPPPVDPPASFAPAADPLTSWNDDDDDGDDGLSGFHNDDESVPLFNSSSSSPGPDDPFGPDPFIIPSFTSSPSDAKEAEEAAELARQLANLSPRAQQAVAAAAAAGTDEERAQAIDRAEEVSDEPINRNLLLKYLSSVDE